VVERKFDVDGAFQRWSTRTTSENLDLVKIRDWVDKLTSLELNEEEERKKAAEMEVEEWMAENLVLDEAFSDTDVHIPRKTVVFGDQELSFVISGERLRREALSLLEECDGLLAELKSAGLVQNRESQGKVDVIACIHSSD
jgi:hypothetical protein